VKSDLKLLDASLAGNPQAFGDIVRRYQSLICAIAYSATGDLGLSEDLAQETFVAAWTRLRELREPAKLRAWLCGIARNLISNSIRRRGRDITAQAEPLEQLRQTRGTAPPPREHAISKEEETILWRALEQIPETYREPMILYYREQQSVRRVAQALGLTQDAAKQRLSRGRRMLKDQVAVFVEKSLSRTGPKKAFTAAVLAAIPATAARAAGAAAVAAKGAAAAKSAAATGLGGWVLGPLLGLIGGFIGTVAGIENTKSPRERKFMVKMAWIISACVLVFLALLFFCRATLSSSARNVAWVLGGLWASYGIGLTALIIWANRRQSQIRRQDRNSGQLFRATKTGLWKSRINIILLLLFFGCVVLCLTSFYRLAQHRASQQNSKRFARPESLTLDNGLTVILLENHKENKVALESFYRAGFIHEPRGKAHISHVVEHMVIRCATRSYKPNESFMLLQKKGMANAETLPTFVHYDYILPSNELELALKIESERLTSIKFSEEILKQEIPKCLQEIEFVQNNPQAGLVKFGLVALSQTIRFGEHFVPVCAGTPRLTIQDVKRFHRKNYTPQSSLLIIVGDFDSQAAKRMVRKYLRNTPKAQPQPRVLVQISRDIRASWDFASDAVYLLYPGPGHDVNHRIALILFGNYLSARLSLDANLKKVTKISFCSNQLYPVGEFPFFIFAEAKKGEPIERVRPALKNLVGNALHDFNAVTFSHTKLALLSFMRSSLLEGGFAPPSMKHEMLLGQEAINLGVKELLRDGLSDKQFLSRLNDLDFKTAFKILKAHLSEQNEKKVIFLAAKEQSR